MANREETTENVAKDYWSHSWPGVPVPKLLEKKTSIEPKLVKIKKTSNADLPVAFTSHPTYKEAPAAPSGGKWLTTGGGIDPWVNQGSVPSPSKPETPTKTEIPARSTTPVNVEAVIPEDQSRDDSPPPSLSLELERICQSLYKTELCKRFSETGTCSYGHKCHFAHGKDELRQLVRHPRYKTELCKAFAAEGRCRYGKRCCFIHASLSEYQAALNRPVSLAKGFAPSWENGQMR